MNNYVIAKYIRLSLDDEASESQSIPHQRLLLNKHIDELEIPNTEVLEFVDNGYTGTNMERPGVQEMLDLVRSGKVNCITVKDFSRFSRNSMDSGYFIEQVFPLYQVRFISVSDRFDSDNYKNDTGGIDVAFKFLMHEYYSKDLSVKIKSARRIQMARGENIVANAIYGYRKNEKGKWEPDPEAADVVRHIFKLALEGYTTGQIRDKMFAERYSTPKEYFDAKKGIKVAPTFMWLTSMLNRMLKNEQYTGCYISGKRETTQVGRKECIMNDKFDWIIIHDSHPALVSKEDFARLQEMLKRPKELAPNKPVPSKHSNKLRSQIVNGERKPCAVPYGYTIGEGGEWIIDATAAKIVGEIYEMALQGFAVKKIAEKLKGSGYPTPAEHIKLKRGYTLHPTCNWSEGGIRVMLKDEQFIGSYVAGKSFQDTNGKMYHRPKSEWIIIPDKHPAIITKDVFMKVQEIRAKSRKNMSSRDYLLRGKNACGCCGIALIYSDTTASPQYLCMHTYADPMAACHKMKISASELDEVVLTAIRKQAEIVLNSKDLSECVKVSAGDKTIADIEKIIRDCIEQRQQIYEQFILCEIDKPTYQSQKDLCSERLEKLNKQIARLRQAERSKQAGQKNFDIAKQVLEGAATPREIVETLIDKVHVFPEKRIEIKWKIADFTQV